ncbi:MerR family transcriptional regulator [Rhodococcus sp. BP-252]|uniref:HTH merR-type domain-containing protein n=1 Tax=Rhodococcoides kyotonense TaxID=398843 RepID=A0A177YKP0_9NOCA|nr:MULTISPECIES: MerR family transcriptional regulator [Rhodococcus]MBY6414763.1 MerR family transcriptional regulator [Rhodococcus sp. BP-320]MBY6419667.1 MerR family transcriptional regulator [Rhodococcus sp. BP-321]MBY6424644.1 MerR family transcriptional regulator [Rhodococcus sp. BP-324]MBY6429641.1 MerR family transcriptional regulator [Rhodococcus sp. BP-323]MBY6434637.1 MerR family transcriptional regulator [Rhodococcus sp. BP-322]
MRIGELARRTGASVRSLRYYEECGLLDSRRSGSGAHRVYDADAVDRVRLLRQLYSAGLSSTVIASILPCVDAPSSDVTRESIAIMLAEHDRLGEQMQALAETRTQLSYLIEHANRYLETATPA